MRKQQIFYGIDFTKNSKRQRGQICRENSLNQVTIHEKLWGAKPFGTKSNIGIIVKLHLRWAHTWKKNPPNSGFGAKIIF